MRNISFDIAAIVILVILLFSIAVRKATNGKANKVFLFAIVICIMSTLLDILRELSDNTGNSALIMLSNTCYLAFHNSQSLIHVVFVISLLDLWHKCGAPVKAAIGAPYAALLLLLLTNPLTKLMVSADSGEYAHGPLFFTVYVCAGAYIVIDVFIVIKNRKLVNGITVAGLLSMAILCLTAVVVHLLLPNQLVECFAVALSLFIVSVAVQRPEDYLDTDTGLFKHSAYGHDAKNSFINKKHWHVVMLNIANYNSIHSMLGYEKAVEFIKVIADKIVSLNKNFGNKAQLYYLDRGRFRAVFPQKYRKTAETFAALINNELKMKIRLGGFDINVSPMIVLARCPEEIESFKSLMAFGLDFHEKIPYTGMVMLASEVYNAQEFHVQNNIDTIIKKALDNNSFRVYYQPIYSIEKGKFVSAEALIRLYDEEHGFISPETLIPAAEKSGAIHKIGELVFEEVCRFVSSDEFKALNLDYIEVNLSVAQCMHGDLADKILTIMGQYNVPSRYINLEITETAASFSQRVMSENLNKLSRAGIAFSLDDYGTGYSNMKRVISLPLKIVKLDKSFVDEKHNPKMWIFLQNTVKMLKDMNMEIVVEGIETQEMVDVFTNLKCDFIQGYYFSKAIPKDEFVKFITEANSDGS